MASPAAHQVGASGGTGDSSIALMRNAWIVLFSSLACFAGGVLGHFLEFDNSLPPSFWPPSGILFAVLLLTESRLWSFLALGALLANIGYDLSTGFNLLDGIAFVVPRILMDLVGAGLIRGFISPYPDLNKLKEVLALIAFALGSSILVATVPPFLLRAHDTAFPWEAWKVSWSFEALGITLYASLLLSWANWRPLQYRRVEFGKIVEGVIVTGLLAFLTVGGTMWYPVSMEHHKFLTIPLVVWAGLRFGPRGVSALVFPMCHIVLWMIYQRRDLIGAGNVSFSDYMVMINGFMTTAAAIALIPAAMLAEREHFVTRLNKINRLNTIIGQINQMVVRTQDARTLLQEACRIMIEFGHFRMAWVGKVDKGTGDIHPEFHAGFEEGYLSIHTWRIDESPWGLGLVGVAYRRGTCAVIEDSAKDPSVKPWREAALKRGYRSGGAFTITLKDQTEGVLVVYSTEPGFFDEEVVSLLREIASDITLALDGIRETEKRRDVEEALRQANERLTGIIQASPAGIVVLDGAGIVQGWNPTAEQMYGYTQEEVVGHFLPTVPGEKETELRQNIATVMAGNSISFLEAQRQHKDGHLVDVSITTAPLKDKTGTIIGLVALYTDLTERKKFDEALRQTHERLTGIIQASPTAIVDLDRDGVVLGWNPAAELIFGYTKEEVIGQFLPTGKGEKEFEVRQNIATVMAGNSISFLEAQRQHKDGHLVDVSLSTAPIRDKAGTIIGLVALYTDLSERKKFDEALRQAHQRLSGIIHASPAGIVVLDRAGVVQSWNPTAEKIFGYTEEEVVGHTLPYAQEGVEDEIKKSIADIIEGLPLRNSERQRKHKDGHLIDVSISSAPLRDKTGTMVGLVTMYEDITEKKRFEEVLRQSEEQFRILIQHLPVGIAVMAPDHKMIFANPAFTEITGYTLEDIPTKEVYFNLAYPDPEYQKKIYEYWSHDLFQDTAFGTYSHRIFKIHCKDGTDKDCLVRTVILSGGQHLYTYYDITERRRAEEALQESEKRLREILETVDMYAVFLDDKGLITFVNDCLLHQTGWTHEEVIGRNWFEVFYRPTDAGKAGKEYLDNLSTGTLSPHGERSILTRDGGERKVTWNNTFLRTFAGKVNGMACLGLDITEHRRLEEQYRQSQRMEAIGQLAGGIAHDFNNLLQAMQGYTDLALADIPPESETHQNLTESQRAIDRAAGLVQQLLAFSRRQTLQFRVIDLDEVISNLSKMLGRVIGEHIQLEIVAGCGGHKVHADPGQMEQILLNICLNARDAMPEGGKMRIETSCISFDRGYVEINSWAKEGDYIQLIVSDTGCGMPPEVLSKIFEPFFTTKAVGQGTGLGLATVYGIIRQHDGMIHVYSEVDHGTTFRVYLPISTTGPAKPQEQSEQTRPRGGTETILVAEDEDLLRELAQRILRNAGYTVLAAANGEEALTLFRENSNRVDLLLLDMVMPKLSGRQVYETVSKENPTTRFIFSTGYSFSTLDRGQLPKEGIPFIQKPYSPSNLLKLVREVLGG